MEALNLQFEGATVVAASAKVNILGFELFAAMETDTKDDKRNIQALIMPGVVGAPQEIKLEYVIGRIKTDLGTNINTGAVDNILEYVGLNTENITVSLNNAFLLYDNMQGNEAANAEYAFSIGINSGDKEFDKEGIFQIKSLYFSVWNSNRQAVKRSMGIGTITSLLEALGGADKDE